jgi:hypothetical protein
VQDAILPNHGLLKILPGSTGEAGSLWWVRILQPIAPVVIHLHLSSAMNRMAWNVLIATGRITTAQPTLIIIKPAIQQIALYVIP